MSIVVGCREFDLEHDYRICKLKAQGQGFEIVKLGDLSIGQVESSLRDAGTDPSRVQPALKPILAVPLHLALFLRLSPQMRADVHNRDELFGTFWEESERKVERRLGRKAKWTETIDRLANWLSVNQELSAPLHVLDDFSTDATAMASEHFLVLADNRYRFFHESLFDYAFARRLSVRGEHLVDLLLAGEQHLFRRAQVRQVLAFLRLHDRRRYLQELEAVLGHSHIRFHVKRLLFQWLSSLTDPQIDEWEVLQRVFASIEGLRDDFHSVAAGQPGWFDVLDQAGFFDSALSSGNERSEQQAVWIMAFSPIMEARSARVSHLLRRYQKSGEPWRQYLRHIYRTGGVFQSRDMFDLFLSHIDDGTLDDAHPGVAVNDNWWNLLYASSEKRPDLACEAIGHWFDRTLARWRNSQLLASTSADDQGKAWGQLKSEFERNGQDWGVISKACAAPLNYAKQMLPRIAKFVGETAKDCPGRLQIDPLWCFRSFGDNQFHVYDALFTSLANSLELVAKTSPTELDSLVEPFQNSPCDAIAFLMLRAWTAAPEVYADRLAEYLAGAPGRLKVGYQVAGKGSFENYVSVQAVKAAAVTCSSERLVALEQAILHLTDAWEAKHPKTRGLRQLELLRAMDGSRLTVAGRARLEELKRKFPDSQHEEPQEMRGGFIGSPIPEAAQAKMSDEQWLKAMRKYAGTTHRFDRKYNLSGGEHQLAIGLMSRAQKEPVRFAALADRMSDDMPASYFDAIIRGVAEFVAARHAKDPMITDDQCTSLIRRVHSLPDRPCGRAITWLFQKGRFLNWREDIIDVLTWYAVNDPNPSAAVANPDPMGDFWAQSPTTAQTHREPDPHLAGINSVRGEAAEAIGQLLFDRPELFERLQDTVHSMAKDPSVAVRSCAIFALLASLNVAPQKAVAWFQESLSDQPLLLGTPYVARFVHYAAYRDFDAVWPIVQEMLGSSNANVVSTGAREVCLLGLDLERAIPGVERVEKGTVQMRAAAATVYAANVSHEIVGSACRNRLRPFFSDPDESVRTQAASAFQHITGLDTSAQADLLAALLDANPGPLALVPVIRALGNSSVQLPDLVCRLAESCVETYRDDAGDISKSVSAIAMDLSKIVIRLYAHTRDSAIQSRCLDMIDEMERHHFLGLSAELQRLDR